MPTSALCLAVVLIIPRANQKSRKIIGNFKGVFPCQEGYANPVSIVFRAMLGLRSFARSRRLSGTRRQRRSASHTNAKSSPFLIIRKTEFGDLPLELGTTTPAVRLGTDSRKADGYVSHSMP